MPERISSSRQDRLAILEKNGMASKLNRGEMMIFDLFVRIWSCVVRALRYAGSILEVRGGKI